MKLNKMLTCIAVMLMTSTAAMAQGAPFKVESYTTYNRNGGDVAFIKLTALDDVTLWDIKLNRDNCYVNGANYILTSNDLEKLKAEKELKKYDDGDSSKRYYRLKGTKLERKLELINNRGEIDYIIDWEVLGDYHKKFGEVVRLETNCQEILEAELFTDKGTWKININR